MIWTALRNENYYKYTVLTYTGTYKEKLKRLKKSNACERLHVDAGLSFFSLSLCFFFFFYYREKKVVKNVLILHTIYL